MITVVFPWRLVSRRSLQPKLHLVSGSLFLFWEHHQLFIATVEIKFCLRSSNVSARTLGLHILQEIHIVHEVKVNARGSSEQISRLPTAWRVVYRILISGKLYFQMPYLSSQPCVPHLMKHHTQDSSKLTDIVNLVNVSLRGPPSGILHSCGDIYVARRTLFLDLWRFSRLLALIKPIASPSGCIDTVSTNDLAPGCSEIAEANQVQSKE